ncbi:hypothetical protein, variant [Sphaeroforma arctica JP610]|uniref:PAS domain-containing protein n=1 Tax=Sphaeroforma arctica JP610 TaxID=667725 RepID=A0A0L0FZB2_9EUKA|nr:hypothetical protein, variant [Sphaeroforma arctica JP610]KNC81303.1 hypothetical protein, variant [Sphaeroforma arctica JP610]|eukprot:XP_014155205.1 hypothetical protein, variant [Sphaeroforma arctica JP610]
MTWFSITISLANMLPYCVTIATMASPEAPLAFVNFNFVSQTKYSVKESLGKDCRFLQGPETKPEHRARFREALENGEACISDITNYKKDGQQFPCRLHLQPVYGKQSKPVFYIGLQTDMSNVTLVNGNNVVLEPLLEFFAANNNSNT